jgi:hypothetical protein
MGVLGCSGDAVIVLVAGAVHQSDEQGAKQHGLTNREAVGRSQRRATSEPEPLKKAGQIVMVRHNGTGHLGCLSDEWK